MTKQELIKHLAAGADVSNKQAEAVVNTLIEAIQGAVARGDEVTLPGIGKLSSVDRPAKTGRNPKTGESMEIPAKRVPKFTAAKALKDAAAG